MEFAWSPPCGVYNLSSFSKLPKSGKTLPWYCSAAVCLWLAFYFVDFVVQQSLLLATFELDFTYDPIVCQVCHTIKSLLP